MKTLATRENLFPAWTNELLNPAKFFGSNFLDFNGDAPSFDFSSRVPSVNVNETEKEFSIEMAAPGLQKKDFKLEVSNGNLTISAEKEEESKEEKKNYLRQEYSYQSFCRTFSLPENTLSEKINAKYDNGILHVVIPKEKVTVTQPAKEIKVG
jgi:HSP20 family protein